MDVVKAGLCIYVLSQPAAFATELYKYKDSRGKWAFSDKAPQGDQAVDKVEYKGNKKGPARPRVYSRNIDGEYALVLHNPYYAPVEVEIASSVYKSGRHRETVTGNTTKILYKSSSKIPSYRYRLRLGDPKSQEDGYIYRFPVSSRRSNKITQGFNGRFSHTQSPNVYALDIALPIGTYISAARGGTVIWVKDDYHMGGKNHYFLDKANFVKVLHEDGTYAVYAHILQGSSLVRPGDKVAVGDMLARSGTSGYSTGPHLHFVIRKNKGLSSTSVPFKFIDRTGVPFKPVRGMQVDGIGNNS